MLARAMIGIILTYFFFADLNGLKNPLTHILPPSLKIFTCGTEPSQTWVIFVFCS